MHAIENDSLQSSKFRNLGNGWKLNAQRVTQRRRAARSEIAQASCRYLLRLCICGDQVRARRRRDRAENRAMCSEFEFAKVVLSLLVSQQDIEGNRTQSRRSLKSASIIKTPLNTHVSRGKSRDKLSQLMIQNVLKRRRAELA